jgi:hypothetical protein
MPCAHESKDMKVNVGRANIGAEAPRPTASGAPLGVERLGARLGAQIHSLDLKAAMSPATVRALEAA